jgi:hypothetical protein
MAKNGHALIFVALKGANFTEVENVFHKMRCIDMCENSKLSSY